MTALRGRRLAVYLFLCAVWGSTWLFIKIGLRDLPPLRFAGLRMAVACLLLVPFAFARGVPGIPRNRAGLVAVCGFLQIGLTYGLLFVGAQWIPSSLAAILFASFPIWTGLFAHLFLPDEPLTRGTAVSALLGLAGVAFIEGPAAARDWSSSGHAVLGGGLVLCAALVSAFANVLNKKSLGDVPPVANVWGQTLIAAVFLLAASAFEGGAGETRWSAGAVGALLYLAVLGTAATFVGLFWLMPRVPVSVVGTIPVVDTLIAGLLGHAVLDERLPARVVVGGLLIVAGVWLAASPLAAPPSRSAAVQ